MKKAGCHPKRRHKAKGKCESCYWKARNAERTGYLRSKKFAKYGITEADYQRLFKEQDGRCAICLREQSDDLCVDHNHKTDVVRQLLCKQCNLMLGNSGDSVEILLRGITYLRKHGEV